MKTEKIADVDHCRHLVKFKSGNKPYSSDICLQYFLLNI